jgi:RND family efflux transporter MFP subunit
MVRSWRSTIFGALTLFAVIAQAWPTRADQTQTTAVFDVVETVIDDFKAVYATVRSRDRIEARVRTPGTIASLKTAVGTEVKAGETLAEVIDPKIALSIQALDARIVGLNSRVSTTKIELDRARKLAAQGIATKARLDEAKLAYEVAANELKAAEAERSVLEKQIEEGAVLAPASGRILAVPVTEGSVVMAGESIATIAANGFLLRLELPERHARAMRSGDSVRLGVRGIDTAEATVSEGKIIRVYPELQGGRVIADAEVESLGDYFVGERARVWISAGQRQTLVVPESLIIHRFGLDLVTLQDGTGQPVEVVVQLGQPAMLGDGSKGVEVLAGLKAGDIILAPDASHD